MGRTLRFVTEIQIFGYMYCNYCSPLIDDGNDGAHLFFFFGRSRFLNCVSTADTDKEERRVSLVLLC